LADQLKIAAGSGQVKAGDFNARVEGDRLVLPKIAADAFAQQDVRTADDLCSYLRTYPSAVATSFHWSNADVVTAIGRLKTVLKGHVSDDLLNGDTTPMPPLGARDPKDLPK
jgi:hypothetical protein